MITHAATAVDRTRALAFHGWVGTTWDSRADFKLLLAKLLTEAAVFLVFCFVCSQYLYFGVILILKLD
jgi:hypothetical protein